MLSSNPSALPFQVLLFRMLSPVLNAFYNYVLLSFTLYYLLSAVFIRCLPRFFVATWLAHFVPPRMGLPFHLSHVIPPLCHRALLSFRRWCLHLLLSPLSSFYSCHHNIGGSATLI